MPKSKPKLTDIGCSIFHRSRRLCFPFILTVFVIQLTTATPAFSQTLQFELFTVADGLVHPEILSIYQDRKGYLWFGGWEGVSKFDGMVFKNIRKEEGGLAQDGVYSILEDREGNLWFATYGGGASR